jgi:hypothetical protein
MSEKPKTVADAGVDPMPASLTLEQQIPSASIVGEFAVELPSLTTGIPGNVSEMIGALADRMPGLSRREADTEAGG